MTDAPQIDDCRRFKELWKELCLARVICGAAAALISAVIYWQLRWLPARLGAFGSWLPFILSCVFLALPSAAAKRGKLVIPLVSAAALGAHIVAYYGHMLAGITDASTTPQGVVVEIVALSLVTNLAMIGAGIGVVEGQLERSLATTFAGLTGGILCGGLAGWLRSWIMRMPSFELQGFEREVWSAVVLVLCLHVGIGLSLAVGRWIRDLPKGKQDKPEPTQ